MFQKEQFGTTAAQEKLASLHGKVAFPESAKIEEVNNLLEEVIYSLQIHGEAPKYVLTRALYDNGDDKTLQSARFVVRPAVSHELEVAELKHTFTITADADFFNNFIQEMAVYFDTYTYHAHLQTNVDELNTQVAEVIAEHEIPFNVEFSLGNGLLEATDEHAVVGLSAEVIENLAELPLFDEQLESRVEGYRTRIAEALKECTRPYDIVKVKTHVTRDLDIYSRRSLNKLIRQFVNRKSDFVRVGVGYIETEEIFAVVEKSAVTEDEAKELESNDVLVVDNDKASKREKEEGKTKIAIKYLIAPFEKENGVPTEVALSEVV